MRHVCTLIAVSAMCLGLAVYVRCLQVKVESYERQLKHMSITVEEFNLRLCAVEQECGI